MQRYFIYLAYDGTNYHGWQIQPNGISVQECLMKALSTFLRREIEVIGAGRTDAGVHASLMVAHFDSDELLDTTSVTDKLNRLLPPDISIYRVCLESVFRWMPLQFRFVKDCKCGSLTGSKPSGWVSSLAAFRHSCR